MDKLSLKFAINAYSLALNGLSYLDAPRSAKWAMEIFKTPRGEKIKAEEIQYLEQSNISHYNSGQYQIKQYHWPNSGPRILLLHGWESNAHRWKPYIKKLQEDNFDIYAIDAPAHGQSSGNKFTPIAYAHAITEICNKIEFDFILGHSAGAYATILFAHDTPHHSAKNLILLAPTGKLQKFMHQFYSILKLNKKVTTAFEKEFVEAYKRSYDYFDADSLISKVQTPGLLIHDKNDLILPYEDSLLINEAWSSGEFVLTEGFGHRLRSIEVSDHVFKYIHKAKEQL